MSSLKRLPAVNGRLLVLLLLLSGCAASTQNVRTAPPAPQPVADVQPTVSQPSALDSIPFTNAFERGLANGTRTRRGVPGENYWQQEVDYLIQAKLYPSDKRLEGRVQIQYHNNSPDTLQILQLDLLQNIHAPGIPRSEAMEVTGGMHVEQVIVEGDTLTSTFPFGPHYRIQGTRMTIYPAEPVAPGETAALEISYRFPIPQQGIGGRMGYSEGLFYIAYWYPQMVVYDDLNGWHPDPFLGTAEFYYDFGTYNLQLTLPEQWVVMATGQLQNAEEVLAPHIRERLARAEQSDEPVMIITEDDFNGGATAPSEDGWHTWHFRAEQVRDVAFSATTSSVWEAARAPVGDRDGDGRTEYTRVDAIYRSSTPLWPQSVQYLQHSISFLSNHLDFPYPYPHMTAVEGNGIIGGGMEYPMMTLIGGYDNAKPADLYGVTVHELSHMWIPMIVNTDERRYGWIDEGLTEFNDGQGIKDYYPDLHPVANDRFSYLRYAGTDQESPIMRRSDHHYSSAGYGVASYQKPATVLIALRAVLGQETFAQAYHAFVDRWAYKHPSPYDFFNTFEDVSGRDLDWFWQSWYFETWTLDQAITQVESSNDQTRILIENQGKVPMPVYLTIHYQNGSTEKRTVPVDRWLKGYEKAMVAVPSSSPIETVVIDAGRLFPDVDRRDNVWISRTQPHTSGQ